MDVKIFDYYAPPLETVADGELPDLQTKDGNTLSKFYSIIFASKLRISTGLLNSITGRLEEILCRSHSNSSREPRSDEGAFPSRGRRFERIPSDMRRWRFGE